MKSMGYRKLVYTKTNKKKQQIPSQLSVACQNKKVLLSVCLGLRPNNKIIFSFMHYC